MACTQALERPCQVEQIFHLGFSTDAREAEAAQHMPRRADVLAARAAYGFGAEQNYFLLTASELERQMALVGHADVDYAVRLQQACVQAEEIRSKSRKPTTLASKDGLDLVEALSQLFLKGNTTFSTRNQA